MLGVMTNAKKKPMAKKAPSKTANPKARSGELSEDQLEHVAGGAVDAFMQFDDVTGTAAGSGGGAGKIKLT